MNRSLTVFPFQWIEPHDDRSALSSFSYRVNVRHRDVFDLVHIQFVVNGRAVLGHRKGRFARGGGFHLGDTRKLDVELHIVHLSVVLFHLFVHLRLGHACYDKCGYNQYHQRNQYGLAHGVLLFF
jgi:hypothetical protein